MNIPMKTPGDSKYYIAEIVGEESLIGQRISAGKLLQMMDIAATTAAAKHCEGPLITLSFDRIELLEYICHMDYVRYYACVIQVGHSSMVVKVDGFYKPAGELELRPGNSGIITVVAIHPDGHPNKNIPGLTYMSETDLTLKKQAESRQRLLSNRKKTADSVNRLEGIAPDRLKDLYPRSGRIPQEATELVIRKRFLPRNTNAIGNVFGGDTVKMMEELALGAARQFTGNFRMVTIAMEDVFFLKPLGLDRIIEMQARIVFVANTTLVVEIAVTAVSISDNQKSYPTNSGLFTILNLDRSGRKKNINNGLDMKMAGLPARKSYLKELIKYEKRKQRKMS